MEHLHFIHQLENLIKSPEKHSYLLAVSGGADSMVLVHLFNTLKNIKRTTQNESFEFQVAHINYKLRGKDSDLDQKVVEDFCTKNNIKFHLYEVSEKDNKPENSIQLWARELRYTFFKHIQKKENLEFLVTAHQLNDQLETFIINLSKAAGISGLSGIPSSKNKILRPLLHFTKEEIYQFAKENNIEYREDLSNKKNDYLRNKIRNEIVPKLLETNENFLENFKKSNSYINQTKNFVQQQIQEIEKRITIFNKTSKIISKEDLNKESDFVKFEILKKYGFNQEDEITKIFKAENGSYFFSKDYELIINYNELVLKKRKENNQQISEEKILLIEKSDFSENQMIVNIKNILENTEDISKSFEWEFDGEQLRFPLKLRKHENGDEFHPLGFSGKKKVSKFFRDEKISILARQKIWILTDNENSVLGIIPFRQDKKYARDEKTKIILKIFNKKQNEI